MDSDGVINGSLRRNGTLELVYLESAGADQSAGLIRLQRKD